MRFQMVVLIIKKRNIEGEFSRSLRSILAPYAMTCSGMNFGFPKRITFHGEYSILQDRDIGEAAERLVPAAPVFRVARDTATQNVSDL